MQKHLQKNMISLSCPASLCSHAMYATSSHLTPPYQKSPARVLVHQPRRSRKAKVKNRISDLCPMQFPTENSVRRSDSSLLDRQTVKAPAHANKLARKQDIHPAPTPFSPSHVIRILSSHLQRALGCNSAQYSGVIPVLS